MEVHESEGDVIVRDFAIKPRERRSSREDWLILLHDRPKDWFLVAEGEPWANRAHYMKRGLTHIIDVKHVVNERNTHDTYAKFAASEKQWKTLLASSYGRKIKQRIADARLSKAMT